jgi:hypothetical protein
LQLGHVLALFAVIAQSGDMPAAVASTQVDPWQPVCSSDATPSGRVLRLRIESLLI